MGCNPLHKTKTLLLVTIKITLMLDDKDENAADVYNRVLILRDRATCTFLLNGCMHH